MHESRRTHGKSIGFLTPGARILIGGHLAARIEPGSPRFYTAAVSAFRDFFGEDSMTRDLARRDFLKSSAALAGFAAAGGFSCIEIASAAPIEVPTVDKLSIRVLVDSSFDQFFRPKQANGVSIAPPARSADFRKSLHNEWGLSLWLESQAAGAQRTLMLD
jgi:hypothetical protein